MFLFHVLNYHTNFLHIYHHFDNNMYQNHFLHFVLLLQCSIHRYDNIMLKLLDFFLECFLFLILGFPFLKKKLFFFFIGFFIGLLRLNKFFFLNFFKGFFYFLKFDNSDFNISSKLSFISSSSQSSCHCFNSFSSFFSI